MGVSENASTNSWEFDTTQKGGSLLMKAIQKHYGASVDGYAGVNTIKAMQKAFGVTVDGYMGTNTVKAFQKYLNTK